MNTNHFFALLLAGTLVPTTSLAQDVAKKDTVQNTKEVKNRNVLLNASSADQARQINIGLPSSLSAPIFEDGLPVSYNTWPDMPYFSWLPGNSYGRIGVLSISESALQTGQVGYTVDTHHKHSTPKFGGTANYQLNQFGRQVLDVTINGPLGKGFGYILNSHQIWDPGTYKLTAANLNTRFQIYKAGLDYTFADGRGYMSLIAQYSRYTSTGSSYAPFIFVGDGSVKKYNGFNYGTDSYYGQEASTFTVLNVMTGQIERKNWKDAGTTTNKQLQYNLSYDFKNGNHLDINSKFKWGKVSMAMSAVSGISPYDANTAISKYYYSDGTEFTGDYIQNRYMMYVPGFEHDWLTTAKLSGKTQNGRHSWRIGANIWYNRAGVQQMNAVMAHEVCNNPRSLYMIGPDGNLVDYSYRHLNDDPTMPYVMGLNPGSGEYYDGHEFKGALFLGDDWTATKWLWMSIGARLEYLGYGGNAALNLPTGATYNSRNLGWSLKHEGATINRFHGDWLNPAFTYNVRAKLLPGFGLEGEYVYVRQRPNLQDYAGSELPTTAPVNINMARGGIYWNTPWMQLVSQVSFITQTNYKSRATFYNTMATGVEETKTIPITYNIQTMGWTTDVVLTPFKGASLHALLTLQNPVYKKFSINDKFDSGEPLNVSLDDNTVTAMSKTLIELDPSYSFNKFRFWLSFRYFSKQYINKTNTLYFNGHWESFGGINYMMNKKVNFALNVVNIFNQSGATGSIGAADVLTAEQVSKKGYNNNYVMSGSYIRPFEVTLSTTINF